MQNQPLGVLHGVRILFKRILFLTTPPLAHSDRDCMLEASTGIQTGKCKPNKQQITTNPLRPNNCHQCLGHNHATTSMHGMCNTNNSGTKNRKTTQLCTAKPWLAHATFTQSESPASLHAQCLKLQTYSRYDYRTTANVSYTVNIQTPPFQRALETMYLKICAIF
jgi:hypothetical protein